MSSAPVQRSGFLAEVVQVIHTKSIRGCGGDDVLRVVDQYWAFDGTLLAEHDPGPPDRTYQGVIVMPPGMTPEDIAAYRAEWNRQAAKLGLLTRDPERRWSTHRGVDGGLHLYIGDETKSWPEKDWPEKE